MTNRFASITLKVVIDLPHNKNKRGIPVMKTKIVLFYAISALSLSMFVIAPAAGSAFFEDVFPEFQIGSVLIESANQMVNVRY